MLCPNEALNRDNGRRACGTAIAAIATVAPMIEDELLKLRFKAGSLDALQRIYQKYRDPMLTVAVALLGDAHAAEDVVHDVFVAFAQSRDRFGLRGSLKGYLATCVANRAKDRMRGRKREPSALDVDAALESGLDGPDQRIVATEQSRMVSAAMVQVPYEQRETIVLHLNADMTFREIARLQGISVSTAKGRYRYGMEKLRSILDGRV